jgi:hypothetical protein
MKLEYVAAGAPECPLVRLYDFTPIEVQQLFSAAVDLASDVTRHIEIHRLSFVQSIDNCQLSFLCATYDEAVVQVSESATFECRLTSGTWDNMAGLTQAFLKSTNGFQWLAVTPGVAALLLSTDGRW